MIARCRWLAVAGALAFAALSPAADVVPEVTVESLERVERHDVHLAGKLVDHAVARLSAKQGTVVLLVRPQAAAAAEPSSSEVPCVESGRADVPLELWRLDMTGSAGALEQLRGDLPADAYALVARDVTEDGADELLLARPGELLLLESEAGEITARDPRRVLGPADFDLQAASARAGELRMGSGETLLALDGLGFTRFYKPAAGSMWKPLAEVPTLLHTEYRRRRLALASPALHWIGRGVEGRALYATLLEKVGEQRLHVLLVRPEAASPETRMEESWAKLPEPEQVLEVFLRLLDGEPVLAVLTIPANKLSVFGEKRLRLYRLGRDRSRVGFSPLFAVETRINLWQQASVFVRDVDGDAREDVVVGYWKGLGDSKLVLDAYVRKGDGSFERSPRTTAVDLEDGDRTYIGYERALDGKGPPDLLLRGGGRLHVFRGTPWGSERRLVEDRPVLDVPLAFVNAPEPAGDGHEVQISIGARGEFRYVPASAAAREPRILDLDGDGRGEILVPAPEASAGDVLFSVIRTSETISK